MNISQIITAIYEGLLKCIPLFRMIWVTTVVIGIAMLIIALMIKRDPLRQKTTWIVGIIGLLLTISSGTQLIMSFF